MIDGDDGVPVQITLQGGGEKNGKTTYVDGLTERQKKTKVE